MNQIIPRNPPSQGLRSVLFESRQPGRGLIEPTPITQFHNEHDRVIIELLGFAPSAQLRQIDSRYIPESNAGANRRTVWEEPVRLNEFPTEMVVVWTASFARADTDRIRSSSAIATPAAAQLRVDRLARVQAAFGFSLQVLSGVLRISRAQLYKWLDAEKDITLQDSSRERLALMEYLANSWRLRSNATLNSVAREPLDDGTNIVELLSKAHIDETRVESSFGSLVDKLAGRSPSLSQRMRAAGFTRRPSHRSFPSDE